jgi:hypothetical protein
MIPVLDRPPTETWWIVGGVPGEQHYAGRVGRFLGDAAQPGPEQCVVELCPNSEVALFSPYQLFPTERPADAEGMRVPVGHQLPLPL